MRCQTSWQRKDRFLKISHRLVTKEPTSETPIFQLPTWVKKFQKFPFLCLICSLSQTTFCLRWECKKLTHNAQYLRDFYMSKKAECTKSVKVVIFHRVQFHRVPTLENSNRHNFSYYGVFFLKLSAIEKHGRPNKRWKFHSNPTRINNFMVVLPPGWSEGLSTNRPPSSRIVHFITSFRTLTDWFSINMFSGAVFQGLSIGVFHFTLAPGVLKL